jgi:hypothetical protein
MRSSKFSFCFSIFLLLSQTGCAKKFAVIPVETLIRDASQYDFKVVTVKGCYRAGLETTQIMPCEPVSASEDSIWIDDIRVVQEFEKIPALREDKYRRRTKDEPLSDAERAKYNEMMRLPSFVLTPVVIRGEFQFSPEKSFGHLGAFKYRIIVYKVIKIG